MRHPIVASFAAALLAIAATPHPATTCSDIDYFEVHRVDAAFADDAAAPGTPSVEPPEIVRGDGGGGCGGAKCGGPWAEIRLSLFAIDDRAPSDRIGFEITVVSGQPPPNLALPTTPIHGVGSSSVTSSLSRGPA